MRVDCFSEIDGGAAHFNREGPFAHKFTCSRPHDPDPQHPLTLRIEENLRQAFSPPQ